MVSYGFYRLAQAGNRLRRDHHSVFAFGWNPFTLEATVQDLPPLAERIRPTQLDEVLGQSKIWAKDAPLRRLVEQDRWNGVLFWGPPGTGKTTVANLIARQTGRKLEFLSATSASVKDIRAILESSEETRALGGRGHVLFLDEIHRLSKSQQDVLLPGLEKGLVRFIGATTENPSFEVNRAILSRCLVFRFEQMSEDALTDLISKALVDERSHFAGKTMSEDCRRAIARSAGGDARKALNLLEASIFAADSNHVTLENINGELLERSLGFDKAGESHFDTVSALIKSIRASHPDAALHYLARMIAGGEDPMFIARRLVIAASEDIGNANPMGLVVATSALQAIHAVGMPEGRIILSQIVTYLAASPKSNRSYLGINEALADVSDRGPVEIPLYLRNAPTEFMKSIGYGKGYIYPHDDLEGARRMAYLPATLKGKRYYRPLELGAERQLKENLERLRPTGDDQNR